MLPWSSPKTADRRTGPILDQIRLLKAVCRKLWTRPLMVTRPPRDTALRHRHQVVQSATHHPHLARHRLSSICIHITQIFPLPCSPHFPLVSSQILDADALWIAQSTTSSCQDLQRTQCLASRASLRTSHIWT